MADEPDDRPSLEMPSFSRKRKKAQAPAPEPATVQQPVVEVEHLPAEPERRRKRPTVTLSGLPAEPERRRKRLTVTLSGLPAAALTGVVVGVLAVLLAWLAGAGCEAARGTSSCGGAAGLPLLVAGLVLLAWVGSVLLRLLGVPDAGSTSVLAVGIMAVLVLVFLLGSLDAWWALVAVPVTAVIGYGASWWVTSPVVGDDD